MTVEKAWEAAIELKVEKIEMIDWSCGSEESSDPIWRVLIDGYCADFPHETAARNFADAISRYASSRELGEIEEQVRKLEYACSVARTALAGMTSVRTAIDVLDCRPLGVASAIMRLCDQDQKNEH